MISIPDILHAQMDEFLQSSFVFSTTYAGHTLAMDTGMHKVLVVDDEDSIRMLVKKVLERAGYDVACARDGCEAIERLAADDYDVVLLDVMMPKLDGFGVVQAMQTTCPRLLARTLLVTASHLKSLQTLPVRGIITKPFSVGELVAETQKCCEQPA